MNDQNIGDPMTAEQNFDCAGPMIRLPFPIMIFLKIYATRRLQHFIYLPYIWRFFCELVSPANEGDQKGLFAASEVTARIIRCSRVLDRLIALHLT